jgi:hypothetical protein
MMMKILPVLFLLMVAAGCSDSNTATSSTSGGDGVTGDLIGSVTVVDYRGRNMSNRSGVHVQFDGTAFSTISNSDGSWVAHNMPTRNYSITFTKEGFSTYKITSFVNVGGGTLRVGDATVVQPCRFTLTLDGVVMPKTDSIIPNSNGHIQRTGSFYVHTSTDVPDSVSFSTIIVLSRSPNINIADSSTFVTWTSSTLSQALFTTDTSISVQRMLYYSIFSPYFSPGETVYIRLYPIIRFSQYYDIHSNQYITDPASFGPGSNVLSGVLQ